MKDSNQTTLEIHPQHGLKMNLITDHWIRKCIGIAILGSTVAAVLVAAAPLVWSIGYAVSHILTAVSL